jgi:hypothetical protein
MAFAFLSLAFVDTATLVNSPALVVLSIIKPVAFVQLTILVDDGGSAVRYFGVFYALPLLVLIALVYELGSVVDVLKMVPNQVFPIPFFEFKVAEFPPFLLRAVIALRGLLGLWRCI